MRVLFMFGFGEKYQHNYLYHASIYGVAVGHVAEVSKTPYNHPDFITSLQVI